MNAVYKGPQDCPGIIPLFPLPGALLLPRGQMPLNIFEPRYLAMIDEAMRGSRIIGMIQPDADVETPSAAPRLFTIGCAGRITQLAETGDGRYLVTLTGISRFRLIEETGLGPGGYRQARVDFSPFANDFIARHGEDEVDREGVVEALRKFVEALEIEVDWRGVEQAPNEALVNALCMMTPFGLREKQALLEAPDLKARAEALIALTEIEIVGGNQSPGSEGENGPTLQ